MKKTATFFKPHSVLTTSIAVRVRKQSLSPLGVPFGRRPLLTIIIITDFWENARWNVAQIDSYFLRFFCAFCWVPGQILHHIKAVKYNLFIIFLFKNTNSAQSKVNVLIMIRIELCIATRANNKFFTAETFIPSSVVSTNRTFHFFIPLSFW